MQDKFSGALADVFKLTDLYDKTAFGERQQKRQDVGPEPLFFEIDLFINRLLGSESGSSAEILKKQFPVSPVDGGLFEHGFHIVMMSAAEPVHDDFEKRVIGERAAAV